jgi:hypothetical protein
MIPCLLGRAAAAYLARRRFGYPMVGIARALGYGGKSGVRTAVAHGVPCITTIQAADAAVRAMEAMRGEEMTVQAVQDRFPKPAAG